MPTRPHPRPTEAPLTQPALQWLIGVMLVIAPLFRSGRPALAVLALELLALGLIILVLWRPRPRLLSPWELVAVALLLGIPLLHLIPLPAGLAGWLPGRAPYAEAQALLGEGLPAAPLRLSVYPFETESALLLLLLPVALVLGVRSLDERRIAPLIHLLLGMGAAQALLGLLQYGAGKGSPAFFGMTLPDVTRAMGTYTNPDHLAGLLEMLLPLALALTFYSVGRGRDQGRVGWRRRVAFFGSLRGHTALVYGTLALLLLLGAVYTRSRAGIALSMLGLLLSTLVFARRLGGGNLYGTTGTLIALALGIGIAIGLAPILDRFSVGGTVEDARWAIYAATLDGIGTFFPLGTGPGTFPDAFPAFQPPELGRWFVNHAHNDYLEWLFEGGLAAALLIGLLAVLYARQWLRVWAGDPWGRFRFIQVGAGIGILMLLLHAFVDFNLHTPANIVYFAFLFGVFLAPPSVDTEPATRRTRHPAARGPQDPVSDPLSAPVSAPGPGPRRPLGPPASQIRNPFLDDDADPVPPDPAGRGPGTAP